ncbi:YybS family protein [Moorella sulfitireducens]|uniref:YybS family protein n=1 Tax=Neomoorella sulfitireducens TaxID=2972948 RepID=UPI0021ABC7C0|nr:YybS family protein [Moorella sulfitireducens]
MDEGRVAALAEGALMAALTVVLVLTGYFIPPLQVLTNIIWTVPIVVLTVRRSLRLGVMATFVASLAIAFFTGPLNAVLLFVQFAGLGLIYGYLFKAKARPARIIVAGGTVSLFSLLLSLFLTSKLTGLPLGGLLHEMEMTANYTLEFYRRTGILERMGATGVTPEELQAALTGMINFLKLLLPGILISASLLAAFINYLVAEKVLLRLGLVEKGLPPFRNWQLPWYAAWGVIAGLALWQLGDYYSLDLAYRFGVNILYVYLPLLAGNGLAAVSFIFYRLKLASFFKVLLVIVALINLPVVLVSLATLGLFDPFFSYRRRTGSPGEGE